MLLCVFLLQTKRKELRLDGDEERLVLRTLKKSRVVKEETFPRASVGGARALHTIETNDQSMRSIVLIVDRKARRLTRWTAEEDAQAWVEKLNSALGITRQPTPTLDQ
ncbi:MAG: hypothetical protein ACKO2G_07265 [Verrucomicrobiales bacterium]